MTIITWGTAPREWEIVLAVALPVYETMSNPEVADSFQFQETYFSVFVFTLSSAPTVKPSEPKVVKVSASVAWALFASAEIIFVTPLTESVKIWLSVASLFLIQVKSGCRSLFPSCVTACVDPSPVYIVVWKYSDESTTDESSIEVVFNSLNPVGAS